MDAITLLAGALLLLTGLGAGLGWGALRWRRPAAAPATGAELAALLAPASATLNRVERGLRDIERDRAGAQASLTEQISALHRAAGEVSAQSRSLASALRAPTVRGRWGEVQLRRVVELAGMVEHCDFDTQVHVRGPDGALRPDLVVNLAGGRHIPVDAKTPLGAWLQALDTRDPAQSRSLLAAHGRAVRAHVDALADKAYWRAFHPAPEFVVMFLPGEPMLDAALSADPSLTEYAFSRNVVIATPTTLITLLRTVAFSWRQERLSASAEQILALGRELHERLATVGTHLARLGGSLDRAVEAYNVAIGSLESRVLVSARRFTDLGGGSTGIADLDPVGTRARRPGAPEFDLGAGGEARTFSGGVGACSRPADADERPPPGTADPDGHRRYSPEHRPRTATVEG